MENNIDIERAFIYRIFFKRGGKTISQSFVEAKNLGTNVDWFEDVVSRATWMAAEEMFGEDGFESVNPFRLVQRTNTLAAEHKEKEFHTVTISHDFFVKYDQVVNGADDLAGFCNLMRNAAIERKSLMAFQEAADKFRNGGNAASTASQLVGQIQNILNGEAQKGKVSVADLVDEVVAQYDNAYHHVQELGETDYTPGLSMPWKKLSFAMNGFTSVLTVLAARPGVGKTSMAVEMMRYWMDTGVKVVFDSLDMAGVEYMKRQLAEMSQVSSRKLQFGKSLPEQWEKYDRPAVISAGERMKKLERDGLFTLFTEPDIDILKANVKILKDQGKIDILVVDYIQLMNYHGSEKVSKQQCVTRVSNVLHSITTELGIPVLALSQINRDSSKDGVAPQLHDIKDSGAIEQDATNVIILHPNWPLKNKWAQTPPTQFMRNGCEDSSTIRSLMPMWVILAKARDGDSGTEIPFVVVQNKYSWYQADYEASDKDSKFLRVWDNWKHDNIEKMWDENGSLIRTSNLQQIEAFNRKLEVNAFSAKHNTSQSGVQSQTLTENKVQPKTIEDEQDHDPFDDIPEEDIPF